jgi:hypothetical protein
MKFHISNFKTSNTIMKEGECMNFVKYVLVVCIVILCASFGFAKKYSDAPAGQGASTIGTAGDYASLFECAQDFNTTANTGSWDVTILNDLTEPANVAIGNWVLDASTVRFKPAIPLTVTFTTTGDNAGVSGGLVIGVQELNLLYGGRDSTIISTNNFFLDGSTTVGGTDRSLTFSNIDNASKTGLPAVLAVYGACTNVQFKNLKVYERCTSNATFYGVTVRARKPAGATLYYSGNTAGNSLGPKDFWMDNCYVTSTTENPTAAGGSVVYLIGLIIDGGGTYVNPATGSKITNCLIEARARGIMVNYQDNVTISNNTIRVNQTLLTSASPYGFI